MRGKFKGFTLVELLVVIAILAILAVVGAVVFSNITKSARDTRRKSDINAVSKAYEVKYSSLGAYQALINTDFASGGKPTPPEGGNYYNVRSSDGAGFKACAKLESYSGSSQYCNMPSIDCFCKASTQGSIQAGTAIIGDGSEIGTGDVNNMVTNPSFESGASGWGFYTYGGGSGSGLVTSEKAYYGSSSYKIIDTGGIGEVAINYSGLSFTIGQKYIVSAWIYSTTTRAAIQGHFGGGWAVDSYVVSVPSNKLNQWYQVSITRVAGGISPALRCGAFSGGGAGTIYCDGVTVEPSF